MAAIGLRGASRRMHEISVCDFLLSFSAFFVPSPHLQVATADRFHDLYVKRRVFMQGSAFWGTRWWVFTFTPLSAPKTNTQTGQTNAHQPQHTVTLGTINLNLNNVCLVLAELTRYRSVLHIPSFSWTWCPCLSTYVWPAPHLRTCPPSLPGQDEPTRSYNA